MVRMCSVRAVWATGSFILARDFSALQFSNELSSRFFGWRSFALCRYASVEERAAEEAIELAEDEAAARELAVKELEYVPGTVRVNAVQSQRVLLNSGWL